MYVFWLYISHVDNFFSFYDNKIRSSCHGAIKIAFSHAVLQVAGTIGSPSSYECYIAT